METQTRRMISGWLLFFLLGLVTYHWLISDCPKNGCKLAYINNTTLYGNCKEIASIGEYVKLSKYYGPPMINQDGAIFNANYEEDQKALSERKTIPNDTKYTVSTVYDITTTTITTTTTLCPKCPEYVQPKQPDWLSCPEMNIPETLRKELLNMRWKKPASECAQYGYNIAKTDCITILGLKKTYNEQPIYDTQKPVGIQDWANNSICFPDVSEHQSRDAFMLNTSIWWTTDKGVMATFYRHES